MSGDVERRLEAVEQGLAELRGELEAERERVARRQRAVLWMRFAGLGVVALAYFLYLRYVAGLT